MQAVGYRIPAIRLAVEHLRHEAVEDGGRAHDAADAAHGRVIGIPDPDRHGQVRCEADRQVVAEVVGRSCLGGDVMSGNDEIAVAAELERPVAVVGQHVRHDEADLWSQRRLALVRGVPVQGGAIVRHDFRDGLRMPVGALGRERACAGGHVDQRNLVAAERQARLIGAARLGQGLHAHATGDVDDPIDAGSHLDLDGRDVERVPECQRDRLPAVIAAVVVARCVRAAVREPHPHRRVVDP